VKRIGYAVTETVIYHRWYDVPDNFDTSNSEEVENLIIEDSSWGTNDGFVETDLSEYEQLAD
jgi:hypothetical protein